MDLLTYEDLIFLGIWVLLGSVLGFFSFSVPIHKSFSAKLKRCLLSIGVGLIISFPLCYYLMEFGIVSKQLSILISGLSAFGLPDFIIKYWPKILKEGIDKVINEHDEDKHDKEC